MRVLLVCLLCVACGDSGGPSIDAPPGGGGIDSGGGPGVVDAGASDVSTSVGDLCATTAFDGGPGSCPGAICCTGVMPYICTLEDDCPGGGGAYVMCNMTSECPGGRICCDTPAMTFCTKPDACAEYGGTVLP